MNLARRTPALLRGRRNALGFSAAEMMAVVALIGIMVLISAPAFLTFYNSMKVRTASHRLMSHLRLCRQMAVARRTEVIMVLQRTNGATTPYYQAWVERSHDTTRDADGVDNTLNNDDDEVWVIKSEKQLAVDRVTFVDTYNDTTPNDPSDDPGSSVMDTGGIMKLRFLPNGQVMRVAADGTSVVTDTTLRMRLTRPIRGSTVDRQDVLVNRAGKVSNQWTRI
jgi:Tfp pilus assembly protein FimT